MVNNTVRSSERYINYISVPPFICQDVITLVVFCHQKSKRVYECCENNVFLAIRALYV